MTEQNDPYKDTVFLPTTDFPMRGDLPNKEPIILKKWAELEIYQKLREQSKTREKYILHDGPPFANGHIHSGTGLNKCLKDFVTRSYQMLGYNNHWVPGWDCHGLPIEWKIEEQYREKGLDKDEVDIIDFRKECREFASKWHQIQSDEFSRLGVWADWDNPYLTMNYDSEATILAEIYKFLNNGMLYKGFKPVMWAPVEKTSLAEAEIEYKEKKSIQIWVSFPVKESRIEALKENGSLTIWTTTPWTIPANRGIAYGDDIAYGLYRLPDGRVLAIAESLAADVKERAQIEEWEQIASLSGKDFEGTICRHPLHSKGYDDFDVPLLSGDHVTDDAGTGFVHTAPAHGEDDFILGQKHGLEVTDNVDDEGVFKAHVPLFAGLPLFTQKGEMDQGHFAVLKELKEVDHLLAKANMKHEYPHSWRSRTPIIFRAVPQWFIAMDKDFGDGTTIRGRALSAIKDTDWVPKKGERRITSMVENRPDWNVSRQRAWGVPIALFVHKETGEVLKDQNVQARVVASFEEKGADAWWTTNPQEYLGDAYSADDYTQVVDVVEVWFESGSTHALCLEKREELNWPADLYLEGSDQHRGWFQSSLMEGVGTRGRAPYDLVATHGYVLDDKGYKMSKSLGNVIAPKDICDEHGADIFRLWAATVDYHEDMRIGPDILKTSTDMYRRFRNTFRFLLGALDEFDASEKLDETEYKNMPELEQLVLHQLTEMDKKVRTYTRALEFQPLLSELHNYCAGELSSFYFDIRKDRLYCDRPDSFERRATRTVLFHIYDCLTAWLAPYLCFTAEESWENMPQGMKNTLYQDAPESIHLRVFPDMPESWNNAGLAGRWFAIRDVRDAVLGAIEPLRKDKTIRSSLEAHPVIFVNEDYMKAIGDQDMAELCITSQVTLKEANAPDDAHTQKDVQGVGVVIEKAEGQKCARCWKILPEVGQDSEYPDLSPRDADAVRWYRQKQAA